MILCASFAVFISYVTTSYNCTAVGSRKYQPCRFPRLRVQGDQYLYRYTGKGPTCPQVDSGTLPTPYCIYQLYQNECRGLTRHDFRINTLNDSPVNNGLPTLHLHVLSQDLYNLKPKLKQYMDI